MPAKPSYPLSNQDREVIAAGLALLVWEGNAVDLERVAVLAAKLHVTATVSKAVANLTEAAHAAQG